MKTLAKTLLVAASGFFFFNCMCEDHNVPKCGEPCAEDVICTAMFATVATEVTDGGRPVVLDEAYTIRESNGDIIVPEQNQAPGRYVVLDDSFTRQLANRTETFRFIGVKNGVRVVDEPFVIGADCCHIRKESGREQILTNR